MKIEVVNGDLVVGMKPSPYAKGCFYATLRGKRPHTLFTKGRPQSVPWSVRDPAEVCWSSFFVDCNEYKFDIKDAV